MHALPVAAPRPSAHRPPSDRRLLARRLLARRRRAVAALLAALAVGCALSALRPAEGVAVLVAARDLPAGALSPADLAVARLPAPAVPAGALRPGADTAGRLLAAPMRRGEPLTDARLLGPGLLAGYGPGLVAAPVRIADPDVARLLAPGDVVDVLATPAAFEHVTAVAAQPVAQHVRVITVLPGKAAEGALVVLAAAPYQAARLAASQSGGRISVAIRPHRS